MREPLLGGDPLLGQIRYVTKSLCRHLYQLMSTSSILSILVYHQSGYHLVYHTGLSLVRCSYLSVESLHYDLCISKNIIMHPISPRSPCAPDVPGAYNVNSSSGCVRPRSFRPQVKGPPPMRPDATGSVWMHWMRPFCVQTP